MYTVRSQSDNVKKRLRVSSAVELWSIIFSDRYILLNPLCTFITETRQNEGIRQDEWNMVLSFLIQYGNRPDLKEVFTPDCMQMSGD